MRRLLAVATLALAVGSVSGCFNPDKPSCSYACSDTTPKCPDDYECRSDGYCHLVGTTDACLFPDAAVPLDMSMMSTAQDLTPTSD